jgi:hypothetical protein
MRGAKEIKKRDEGEARPVVTRRTAARAIV